MNLDLSPYSGKKICVAVSGGRDSMALLHYFLQHANKYGIALSALNCDHCMRGEESRRDSAFVADFCARYDIPLLSFSAEGLALCSEREARDWRLSCYAKAIEGGADMVATAHHLDDNAETVLFNLARGASPAGMTGIGDSPDMHIVRPMIAVKGAEIDEYVKGNGIEYVTDSTNLTTDYTRNRIRAEVLPALESAVPGAAEAIFRFSRLCAEDEEYFAREVEKLIYARADGCYVIPPCDQRVIFRRAAREVVAVKFRKKDYTAEQFERLYGLQYAENGKRFCFLGLTAVKEEGGIALVEDGGESPEELPFADCLKGGARSLGGVEFFVGADGAQALDGAYPLKALRFDIGRIPEGAVVRFRRDGDRFTKFGGGTKTLSDYLTDRKVPQSARGKLPLVCSGSEVLIVGGVEISQRVKVDGDTREEGTFICPDPFGAIRRI